MNIDWQKIQKAVIQWLVENTISRVDAETIQKVIRFGLGKLKELAAETSTPLDDWAVSQLETYLDDAAKIEMIRAFIVEKLKPLYASTPEETAEGTDEWQTLADSLATEQTTENGTACASAGSNILITLALKYILTAVIEYFTSKDGE